MAPNRAMTDERALALAQRAWEDVLPPLKTASVLATDDGDIRITLTFTEPVPADEDAQEAVSIIETEIICDLGSIPRRVTTTTYP